MDEIDFTEGAWPAPRQHDAARTSCSTWGVLGMEEGRAEHPPAKPKLRACPRASCHDTSRWRRALTTLSPLTTTTTTTHPPTHPTASGAGMEIDRGFISPYFVKNQEAQTRELEAPASSSPTARSPT